MQKGDRVFVVINSSGSSPSMFVVEILQIGKIKARTNGGTYNTDLLYPTHREALAQYRVLIEVRLKTLKTEVERWEKELAAIDLQQKDLETEHRSVAEGSASKESP